MEPSRDDFIIALRSAFLKKGTKQRFSLVALLVFSIGLIILAKISFAPINYLRSGINEIVYRTSFIASIPEKYIGYSIQAIQKHLRIYKDFNLIEEELKKIKVENYKSVFLETENERLKKILDDIAYFSDETIAKVLIDKQSPFLRSIIINKGSNNGLKKGMAVLNDQYLIGKIVEVNFSTSRVLLLSDLNSRIPVSIEPGGIQSILTGNGKMSGIIQYTKKDVLINEESVVYTSGTGDLLKPGIPIGKISSDKNLQKLDFFSDFSQLRYIKVVSYSKEENK